MSFFHTLNYSSCNEDGLTELRALDVQPGDHVCCITGSGDRVLHMLLGNPDQVSAFDLNPAQNYLLELKISAIRTCKQIPAALHTRSPSPCRSRVRTGARLGVARYVFCLRNHGFVCFVRSVWVLLCVRFHLHEGRTYRAKPEVHKKIAILGGRIRR